jgi:hypothetical protein
MIDQCERLRRAQKSLAKRHTKKAADDIRIATKKIAAAQRRLDDLDREEPVPKDSRIHPGDYAPVMIAQGGERLVIPMRYQCRLAGKPTDYDERYPGTYTNTTLSGRLRHPRPVRCDERG